jgi:hypothetical protein
MPFCLNIADRSATGMEQSSQTVSLAPVRLKSIFTSTFLFTSLLIAPISIPNSTALGIKVAPANTGFIYASGKSTSIQSTPRLPSANLEKKSNFLINFNTVPSFARASIQTAVDVWAEKLFI